MKTNNLFNNITIYSGGQTGVDRAALDFCIDNKINHAGFCPKGSLAEDGKLNKKYNLTETKSENYNERTRLNVLNSDISLIIYDKKMDAGTKYTKQVCIDNSKECLTVDIDKDETIKAEYLLKYTKINIAGPRESSSQGIYNKTYNFLNQIFSKLKT